MTLTPQNLDTAIAAGDPSEVAAALRGATEKERRACNKEIQQQIQQTWDFLGEQPSLGVAALGTAAGVGQVARDFQHVSVAGAEDAAVSILADRQPAWLQDLPDKLLANEETWPNHWTFVRALVRAGLVLKPVVPGYTTLMPHALGGLRPNESRTLEDLLLADTGLLEDEVFRLFEVEGAARRLYWADLWLDQPSSHNVVNPQPEPTPERTWRGTLARLAAKGRIDRGRLLDACLGAFLRDFPPTQVGWYVGMHAELAPSLDELAARTETYLRLLAADASVAVGLAQKAIGELLSAGRIDPVRVVDTAEPPLHRREKTLVMAQLKLLDRVAREDPGLTGQITQVASVALGHERSDVQAAALALARRYSPSGTSTRALKDAAAGLSPALREEARDLGVISAETEPVEELRKEIASLRQRVSQAAPDIRARFGLEDGLARVEVAQVPLPVDTAAGPGAPLLPPLTDPEDLIELLTRLVERIDDPMTVERALAGAVRTAFLPLQQRRRIAGPLTDRAREQMMTWPHPFTGHDVRADVAAVAFSWATGWTAPKDLSDLAGTDALTLFAERSSSVNRGLQPTTLSGVFSVRAVECTQLIARGRRTELLAEPTSDRGAVSGEALLERVERLHRGLGHGAPARYDLEVAALRLDRDLDERFWRHLRGANRRTATNLAESFEKQFPVPQLEPVIGWTTGTRLRPQKHLVALARTIPSGGPADTASVWALLIALDTPLNTYQVLMAEREWSPSYDACVAAWPLMVPWHAELMAAHLLGPLSAGLRPGRTGASTAVSSLIHPGTPLGPIGHLALAVGLTGATADTRTASADVLATAARDGRLNPSLLAESFRHLAAGGVLKLNRVMGAVRPVVPLPIAAYRIAESLALALPAFIEAGSRDLHLVLALLADLSARFGPAGVPPEVTQLAERRGGSLLIKEARRLAAISRASGPEKSLAAIDALDGLLTRAGA